VKYISVRNADSPSNEVVDISFCVVAVKKRWNAESVGDSEHVKAVAIHVELEKKTGKHSLHSRIEHSGLAIRYLTSSLSRWRGDMFRALCPDCSEVVELKESVRVGDRVICVECGIELEVLSLYPLDLDYVLEDDWDDDWEEEEEEEKEDDWEDD